MTVHNRFNGHTWIVFIVCIVSIVLMCLATIGILGYMAVTAADSGDRITEIGGIIATPYAGYKGIIVISEVLAGREVTESLDKKDQK